MVLSEPNKEAGGRMNVFHYTAFVVQIIRENGLVRIQIVGWRWRHQRHQYMHLKEYHYSFLRNVSKTSIYILFTAEECHVGCARMQGAKGKANRRLSRITL
jgi:hypothetical protein